MAPGCTLKDRPGETKRRSASPSTNQHKAQMLSAVFWTSRADRDRVA
jgi:hypothetical protein